MAAPNEPPRRVSMSYLLGLSNKPFKDAKPPPRPRQPPVRGIDEVLGRPAGLMEWVASDGRKGKLTGHGKARTHSARSRKASSEKGEKSKEDKKDKAKDGDAAEDENPHAFTADEDSRMLEWKAGNNNLPWTKFGDEIGKTKEQCKERWNQIKPKDGYQNAGKEQGGGGGKGNQGAGGGGGGGNHQQQDQPKLTKRERKAQKQGQDQSKGQQNKRDQASGSIGKDGWGNDLPGNDDTGGGGDLLGMGGMFEADDGDKKSDKSGKKSNKDAQNDADAGNLWGSTTWGNDNNDKSSKKDGGSNKGGNTWENNDGNPGWGGNDKSSGSKKGGSTTGDGGWAAYGVNADNGGNKKGGTTRDAEWGATGVTGESWENHDTSGNKDSNFFDATAPTGWSGAGDTFDTKQGWDNASNKSSSKKSNAGNTWPGVGGDAANDTNAGAWNNQTTTHNNGSSFDAGNAWAGAAKASEKAPSAKPPSAHHSHKSNHHHPIALEVKPDDTFSADDLRLVARILQQDYAMVWDRVSWRFRDKTGRTVRPEVFEAKILGRIEGGEGG